MNMSVKAMLEKKTFFLNNQQKTKIFCLASSMNVCTHEMVWYELRMKINTNERKYT